MAEMAEVAKVLPKLPLLPVQIFINNRIGLQKSKIFCNIVTSRHENRSIQGTTWLIRKEWLKVAHIFNKYSEIKRIKF